jgi:molybdopterin converting factor subunit 1
MKVTVCLFARARDLAGGDTLFLEIPADATLGELRRQLGVKHPSLGSILDRCAMAVNNDFAHDSSPIPAGAQIAVLPPVSGG